MSNKTNRYKAKLAQAEQQLSALKKKMDWEINQKNVIINQLRNELCEAKKVATTSGEYIKNFPGFATINIGRKMEGFPGRLYAVQMSIDFERFRYDLFKRNRGLIDVNREIHMYCEQITREMFVGMMKYMENEREAFIGGHR